MAQVTASEVAKHILANFTARGEAIGNLKLQKLLYYTQGWHLALYCESLFDDRIEAWVHGPVVPGVFREYREFKWTPIVTQPGIVDLPRQVVDHIGEVLDVYEKFSPWDLERMTHNEAPWKEARGPLPPDVPSNALINHESMRLFFTRQMNG